MKKNFNEFIERLDHISNDQTAILFKNSKLNQNFIIMSVKGSHNKIMILNPIDNMNDIATILYTARGHKTFISSFEVNENYQQCGLGRLLFDIALTHSDILGITTVYGDADPINNIKGVSRKPGVSFDDERTAIKNIYQKLGCRIENDDRFYQDWKEGEKIKQASPLVLETAYLIAEKDGFIKDQNQPQ